jgi:FemAB-related protein (PEP-CTERM system-associated)
MSAVLSEVPGGLPLAAPQVRQARDADAAPWDAFVESNPAATFFHLFKWKRVIERAFGHRTHFLLAEREGRIVGVLPLAQIRSLLFGHSLISTPFCVYGGPVATDVPARDALIDAACKLATDLGVDYLELRNLERMRPEWPAKDLYVTFRKTISQSSDDNLKAIPRKQRAVVRAGIDAGVLKSQVGGEPELAWRVYSESVRNLGTPVFSRRYFKILAEEFGKQCDVLTIVHGDVPVASVMSFYFRDEVLPFYGGGTAQAREVKANDFMYWELMRRSAEAGLRIFDYGRSKRETGSYKFKKHWGFEETPLHYEYFLVKATAMPNVSPTNPKYKLFLEAWRRMPLWMSRMLGPLLARDLG